MVAEKPDEKPGEKRRASARLREPAAKRHASNSVTAATEKPIAVPAPKKVVVVKEKTPPPKIVTLPTKVVDGKPLPATKDLEGVELSESELQSVSERCVY
jgi:hypothetical protein